MRRQCNPKITATSGPAGAGAATIRTLFEVGADGFRLDFRHGGHDDHGQQFPIVRRREEAAA